MTGKELLKKQLRDLGVGSGDTVFVAADLLKVGFFFRDRDSTLQAWVEIFRDVLGDSGTLVIPAYTRSFLRFRKDKSCVSHKGAESTSGSLSIAFSSWSKAIRSTHPTNSCLAVGPNAEIILAGHNEKSASYLPYHRVIELGGKNLMLGCARDRKLAPMALHAAQEYLGHTRRKWQVGLYQTYYVDCSGATRLFTRWDYGGCTSFGYKALGHHLISDAIAFGMVGKGLSACIDCKKSFDIFLEIYRKCPELLKCDDGGCPDCWASPIYAHPIYWAEYLLKVSGRVVVRFSRGLSRFGR